MTTDKKLRRKLRTRKKIKNLERPRLHVFRSNKHIHAQVIDDASGKTIVGFSDLKLKDTKGTKTEIAGKVGEEIAKLAVKKGVKEVVFDRGAYKYHGRVKALAEKAREAGLKF